MRRRTSAISRTAVRILEGREGVGSSDWNDSVPIATRGNAEDTHICMKLGRIPFHKLHEVPRLGRKEYFVAILKFRSEILAGEIVKQLHKYGHSLSEQWIWGCEKSRDRQLEEAKVRSEELGVD
jgi:hypothetical protein